MRVQKIIAARGLMSRRAAEEFIKDGRVTVNGRPVCLGDSAEDGDVIAVDGKPLDGEPEKLYIMLNKPRGVVSTMSDEHGRPTVAQLVADVGARVLPVGRLDMDSEGLLLLTNDNELIHKLTHPSHEVDKEYHAYVRAHGNLEQAVEEMRKPMEIEGYTIRPAAVHVLEQNGDKAVLSVVIHEGRKRQVRLMCKKTNLSVDRLVRVRIGDLELGDLELEKWKHCVFPL